MSKPFNKVVQPTHKSPPKKGQLPSSKKQETVADDRETLKQDLATAAATAKTAMKIVRDADALADRLRAVINGEHATLPEPVAKSFVDFKPPPVQDPNTLLGNRWVCRGGSGTITGSTGIGKSVLTMQLGLSWALGEELFGIKPSGPLKVLCIQAENDDGDLGEMTAGALKFFDLSEEELALARKNFIIVTESARSSERFVKEVLEPLIIKHRPDLVILDPGLAYVGGDASTQEVVGDFLRNQITPLLQQHKCAVFVICHTAKPATRDGVNPKGAITDYAYATFGSAEWSNWARAMLNFSADPEDPTVCTLRVAKRFRLGWKDEAGEPVYHKTLRQNRAHDGLLYFEELPDEEAVALTNKKRLPNANEIHSVLAIAERPLSRDEWFQSTNARDGFKKIELRTFKARIEALHAEGRVKREGKSQQCRYSVQSTPAAVPRKTIASAIKARA